MFSVQQCCSSGLYCGSDSSRDEVWLPTSGLFHDNAVLGTEVLALSTGRYCILYQVRDPAFSLGILVRAPGLPATITASAEDIIYSGLQSGLLITQV